MRKRFRYDPDLDAVVEIGNNFYDDRERAPNVISDDVGAGVNGLLHMPSRKMLDSKSAHYRTTREMGLEHIGNQTDFASKRERLSANDYGREVKTAVEQIQGDWNGTRSWLDRQRERRS